MMNRITDAPSIKDLATLIAILVMGHQNRFGLISPTHSQLDRVYVFFVVKI
jgi:hypothetical protein